MKIYVDGDGCPVVHIAIRLAKEYDLEIIIVKNYAHEILDSYASIVSVDISKDSADFYIVNQLEEGDIVISQDYGLASMGLSKKARVLNQNGLILTQDNIEGMLNRRHLHQQLRRENKYYSKTRKRNPENDVKFEESLRALILAESEDL